MKILITSDWHGDANTAGVSREDDVAIAVREVILAAANEEVDLVFFLGDLCDPDSTRTHRAAALGTLAATTLWVKHRIPSRWLVGNHDVIEDGSGGNTLAGISAVEYAFRSDGKDPPILVYEQPAMEIIHPRLPGREAVTLVALPFTPRSHPYDPADYVRWASKQMPVDGPWIIAGHLNVEGIEPGSETNDMPRGRDVFFPVKACKECFPRALLLNGHYHQRQLFNGVLIPGALERLTFGEEHNTPGFLIVEV